MAGDVPLPKRIFAHGLLLFENDKMSKSRGNIVRTDPIREVIGHRSAALFPVPRSRLRAGWQLSVIDALVGRYNSELANGLGNLASRTLTMIKQYRDGVIPQPSERRHDARRLRPATAIDTATRAFDAFEFSRGLEAIWSMLSAADKFIVEQAPWKLAKADPEAQQQLDDALYASAEMLRIAVALLHPVLPESTANIWAQLGMTRAARETGTREARLGPTRARAEDRHDRARLPAHRRQERHRTHARAGRRGNRAPGEATGP